MLSGTGCALSGSFLLQIARSAGGCQERKGVMAHPRDGGDNYPTEGNLSQSRCAVVVGFVVVVVVVIALLFLFAGFVVAAVLLLFFWGDVAILSPFSGEP